MAGSKRILIVDDEARVLLVLSTALKVLDNEFEVATARNGREAITKIEKGEFDLIITDIKMPGIDGVQLTERIRSIDPDAIVVWITGYGCFNIDAASTRLDVFRCLNKPVKIGQIRQVASEALQAHSSG
jgi:YesN/AraC family two-component response regulator